MNAAPDSPIAKLLATVHQIESRRILATLIRLLGDFDLAEDALQAAFPLRDNPAFILVLKGSPNERNLRPCCP